MYSYFPAARQTFWIYCAGTAALSECPDTQSLFLSNGTGVRKQPRKAGHVEKPP